LIEVDRDFDVDEFNDGGAEPAFDPPPSSSREEPCLWDEADGDGGPRASA